MARLVDSLVRYEHLRRGETVTLSEEIAHIDYLVEIFKIRFGEKLEYSRQADTADRNTYLPHFTVMAFVKNALCHGLEPKEGMWKLALLVKKENDRVFIRISDNGTGFDPVILESPHEDKGLGYGCIRDVLSRLKEFYGDREKITVSSSPGNGTDITMELPV